MQVVHYIHFCDSYNEQNLAKKKEQDCKNNIIKNSNNAMKYLTHWSKKQNKKTLNIAAESKFINEKAASVCNKSQKQTNLTF